jgi:putative tricarboxylic transport membrane protein
MEELVATWSKDPDHFAFGGGSLGSVDQMIITRLAIESGIEPTDVNYIAYSGGGELATSQMSGTIKASVSGYQDFKDQIEAGRLRAIAVSAPKPVDYIDLPTLIEEGFDVDLTNWRGLVAPPGISAEDRRTLIDIVTVRRDGARGRDALSRNDWEDSFVAGDEFTRYLTSQRKFVDGIWKELGY